MSLVELSHSGTKFAALDNLSGSLTLNTKNKLVNDFIKITTNISDPNLIPENIKGGVSIFGVSGNIKNIQCDPTFGQVKATAYTTTGLPSITVAKTGTYNCYWVHYAQASSTTYYLSRIQVGSTTKSGNIAAPIYSTTSDWIASATNVALNAGDVLQVAARSRGTSYYTNAGMLVIVEV